MADSTSSQSSGVTGGDLSGFVEQEEISDLDLFEKEPTSSEWTDEKHSMYLKSIENSFVQQLYSSLESSGLYSQMNNLSHMKSSKHNESHSADQFKVYQHGCRQKMKVGRGEPPPQRAGKCRFILQNPWIEHYRSRERDSQTIEGSASFGSQTLSSRGQTIYTHALANMSDDFSLCQTIGDSSLGEGFSGQNFDEDNEGRTCNLRTSKRMKTVAAVAQNHE